MNGWIVAGLALTGFGVWAVIETRRERRRQRALAMTRPPLDAPAFAARLADHGIAGDLATFLWTELQSYYFAPLTPYPNDRIYGDMRIDPDDISDIALRFEDHFGAWLGEMPIECPDDPTTIELAVALQRLR